MLFQLSYSPPPQWSPPLSGGTTTDSGLSGSTGKEAAMEPAAERRDDGMESTADIISTIAAMEPAAERRDDRHPDRPRVADPPAAMEPAAERRDDLARLQLSGLRIL